MKDEKVLIIIVLVMFVGYIAFLTLMINQVSDDSHTHGTETEEHLHTIDEQSDLERKKFNYQILEI